MGAKLIRFAVAALLALFILVVGGAGLMLLAFNPNQYKAALINAVQERYHRTLALPGTLELHLFPPFTLRTGPMRLSEPGSSALFAQASDMRLHLDFLALLRRRLVVDRIALDAPHVVVQRDANGQFNFNDLLPPAGGAPGGSTPGEAPSHMALVVRNLSISGGDVTLNDGRTGIEGRLTGLNLTVDGFGDAVPGPMRLSARAVFVKPSLNASIDLKGQLQATPQGAVQLHDFMLRCDGSMLGVKQLLSNVSGSLDYMPFPAASGRAGGSLKVRGLLIKAQGQNGRGQPLQFDASLPALSWAADRLETAALTAQALFGAAPTTVHMDLHVPAASGPAEALRLAPVELGVQQGAYGGASALQARLAGSLSINVPAMSAVLDAGSLQGSWRPAGASAKPVDFALQGHAAYALAARTSSFDVAGRAGASQLTLRGSSLKNAITMSATVDRLDIDARPGTEPGAAKAQAGKPPMAEPAAAAPSTDMAHMDLLKALDLDAELDVGALRVKGMEWRHVQAHVHGDGNVLTVEPFSMQGYGGTVNGSVQLQWKDARITFAQVARNVQIEPIVEALSGHDALQGVADASIDVTSRGLAPVNWLRELDGRVQLKLSNGAVKGFDLERTLRLAGSLPLGGLDRVTPASGELRTTFSAASARFDLARGVATSHDIALQSPLLHVTGHGVVDLPAQTLDMTLSPTLTGKLPGEGGARAAELQGLRVPVRVSGPFAQPVIAVLWSRAAAPGAENLLKQRAEQALRKRFGPRDEEKLREQLQKGLRGLGR
ncbi:MAG: AsmA family protein [Proteobacteria bacterium]|nr:AsmA family protein [Pseudomonadota bacterium]